MNVTYECRSPNEIIVSGKTGTITSRDGFFYRTMEYGDALIDSIKPLVMASAYCTQDIYLGSCLPEIYTWRDVTGKINKRFFGDPRMYHSRYVY